MTTKLLLVLSAASDAFDTKLQTPGEIVDKSSPAMQKMAYL